VGENNNKTREDETFIETRLYGGSYYLDEERMHTSGPRHAEHKGVVNKQSIDILIKK